MAKQTLPNVQPPTPAEIREKAAKHHIDLTDEEVEHLTTIIPATLSMYERIDALAESTPEVRYTDRHPGYRPDDDEDPLNATIRRCEVRGADDGPLSGYDVGLKDNVAVAGVEMTLGSKLLEGYVPATDATIVTWMLDAGATIAAKLNMEDMAFAGSGELSAFGPVSNPHDPDYLSGGSSSGSAAAVVAGDVDVAIGGDQGGSIRIPASWSGCVGHKPTFGLVPYTGIVGLGRSFDHAGPMTRTVDDCALLLDVIAGKDPLDPRQGAVETDDYTGALDPNPEGLTVGVVEEGFDRDGGDPAVDATVRDALSHLEGAGATVREVSVPMHDDGLAIWNAISVEGTTAIVNADGVGHYASGFYDTGFADAFGRARRAGADDFPPTMKLTLVVGQYLADEYRTRYYAKAQNLSRELADRYDDALSSVDVLAMPTTTHTAHERTDDLGWLESIRRAFSMGSNTAPFDATGHPAVSVPCGTADGLPVGLMFAGGRFDDATVLRAASALEGTIDWESF